MQNSFWIIRCGAKTIGGLSFKMRCLWVLLKDQEDTVKNTAEARMGLLCPGCARQSLATCITAAPWRLAWLLSRICTEVLSGLPQLPKTPQKGAESRLICVGKKWSSLITFSCDLYTAKWSYSLTGSFWLHIGFAREKEIKKSPCSLKERMLASEPWQIL